MKKSESVVWLVTRTGSFADVLAFAIVALLLVVFTLCKINLTRTPKKEDSLRPAEAASPCDEHNKSVLELLNEVQKDIELMSSSLIQSANWLNEKDCAFPKCAFLQLHNSMCMKNFRVGRLLGKGSFGEVVMVSFKGPARKLNARSFAMKYLRCDKRKRHKNGFRMAQERNILIRLQDHPFIIRLVTSFEEHGIIHLITDYYAGGDLKFQLLLCGTFGEEVCKFYGAEILLALEHLHSKGILLRDLKPANILLDGKGHIRLADFGLAKAGIFRSAAGSTTRAGSPAYMAPECRAGKEHGLASDWWSYGATLYDMLVGHPPRQGAGHCCRKGGSGGGAAALELPRALSPTARYLLAALLAPRPERRPGGARAGGGAEGGGGAARGQPFFQGVDFEAILARKIQPPPFARVKKLHYIDQATTGEQAFVWENTDLLLPRAFEYHENWEEGYGGLSEGGDIHTSNSKPSSCRAGWPSQSQFWGSGSGGCSLPWSCTSDGVVTAIASARVGTATGVINAMRVVGLAGSEKQSSLPSCKNDLDNFSSAVQQSDSSCYLESGNKLQVEEERQQTSSFDSCIDCARKQCKGFATLV